MDSAIEKLGIYEFFSVFLSGLMFVSTCLYTKVFEKYIILNSGNGTIDLIAFFLFSYLCGLILQSVGSIIDRKRVKSNYRKGASRNFLNAGKHQVFKNEPERSLFAVLTNRIWSTTYTGGQTEFSEQDKCEYVFHYCKTYLEVNNKISKIERMNSVYGMFRGMMVGCIAIAILHLGQFVLSFCSDEYHRWPVWGLLVILSLLVMLAFAFGRRCIKFAERRVRVVLRQYYALEEGNIRG